MVTLETTGGPDGRSTDRAMQAFDRAVVALVATCAVYTLWRGATLQVEYYDGYRYLANASRLLGEDVSFDQIRPPLLTLLLVPVVALGRLGGPANAALVFGPHLFSAVLSLCTAAAVFVLFAAPCGRRVALVGTLLFMTSRYFVRYGAHVMTDVVTAGASALSVALWMRARTALRFGRYALFGAALGAAMAMKFSSALLLPALLAAELVATVGESSTPQWRRFAGLGVAAGTAAGFFLAAEGLVLWRVHGSGAWRELGVVLRGAKGAVDAWPGESWRDYVPMLQTMVSLPVVVLAVAGMARALWRPERRDVPFWSWLLLIGGSIVLFVGHTEARYLLPALPPFFYFALRAVELPGRFGVALLVLPVVASIANGAAQAWSDQDPVFRHDVQRRAVAFAAASLRHDGRLWILGRRHTLSAQEPGPVPQDEFWNTFHFERHVAEYFVGRQLPVLPLPNGPLSTVTPRLAAQVADGDAVLRLNDVNYYTSRFPTGPHPAPLEVWSIRRLDFHATPGSPELLVDNAGASLRVELGQNPEEVVLTPDRSLGDFAAFLASANGADPRFAGHVQLTAWTPASVAGGAAAMPASVILLRVDVEHVGL